MPKKKSVLTQEQKEALASQIIQAKAEEIYLGAIQKEIDKYNFRPAPKSGTRYKRTPIDHLIESGLFTVENIQKEYNLIKEKKSTLPSNQRDVITHIIYKAFFAKMKYLSEVKAAEEKEEVKS